MAHGGYLPLLASSISLQLRQMTGLPVDFQLQRRSDQAAKHAGRCEPLGVFPTDGPTEGEHRAP